MPKNDDIAADYAQAGFGLGLTFGQRPALIVIDMARAYFEPDAPLYLGSDVGPAVLASVGRLIDRAREDRVPVIFTEVRYRSGGGGVDGGIFFRKVRALQCFEEGNPWGEFMDPVRPLSGETVITKKYASSFFGTPLASTLTSMGIDTVIICGVSTSGCVRATTLDACQHGFVPIVVRDGCGDRSPTIHEGNLFDLQQKYAEVRSEAEALAHLESTAVGRDQP